MTRNFNSFLAKQFEEYISYRQGLGYTEKNIALCLSYLDNYLKDKEASLSIFNPSFLLAFKKNLDLNPKSVNGIITVIRGFFHYLIRLELLKENPLADIPSLTELHFLPFVFSSSQAEEILTAIQKRIRKNEHNFLPDLAKYTAFVLLVRCGLRLSEPTKLQLKNYQPQEGAIYIEKTKFKKNRLLPLPRSVIIQIDNYLSLRRSLIKEDNNPYLLILGKEEHIRRYQLYPVFNRAIKDIGLNQNKITIANTTFGRPTPHSLRHSFAINTLKKIKEQGKSTQRALPVLAVYMGHCHYCDTAVYLKVIDEKQRLELLNFAKLKQK